MPIKRPSVAAQEIWQNFSGFLAKHSSFLEVIQREI